MLHARTATLYKPFRPVLIFLKLRVLTVMEFGADNYASIKIVILHPFWQTWWFITLVIVMLAAILYYLSTIRIKNLLAIEKLKSKLAADLHDNIGSGLTEISILK
jgi:hypothetical protein